MSTQNHLQERLEVALLSRNRLTIQSIIEESYTTVSRLQVIDTLVVPTLEHIGNEWEHGTIALSQVYMSARICEDVVRVCLPSETSERLDSPKIALAVLQDHHLLGKRIVGSVLRASGYDFLDYGHGIAVDTLVQKTQEDGVEVLLLSTLMLHSAYLVKEVSTQLKEVGNTIKIVVGGAPFRFDTELWKAVGADAMGFSASDALEIVATLSHHE